MTEMIREHINEIKTLFETERKLLSVEKAELEKARQELDKNIDESKNKANIIATLETDIANLKSEISRLEEKLTNQNTVENAAGDGSKEYISELVKEIEDCISQLKKNGEQL